jgi:hypothetical protein
VASYVWWTNYDEIANRTGTSGGPNSPAEPNYSKVEDGLFIGGSVQEPPPGTRAVLNLCEQEDPYRCEIHQWNKIPDAAPAPSIDWLRQQVEFVDAQRRAGVPTYVHCAAGISRAGMVTTAYLMFKNNWGRDEALAFLRSKRPQVNPNSAFMELLQQWESEVALEKHMPTPDADTVVPGKYELLKALDNLKQFAPPGQTDDKDWKWAPLEKRVFGVETLQMMPREVK